MTEEYNLVPILEPKSKTYQIERFEEVKKACAEFITDTTSVLNLEDLSPEMHNVVKKARTEIRKKLDQVKRVRIDCNKLALEKFNEQAKSLEDSLQSADNELKAYVDKYAIEVENKQAKPAKITLTVKGTDMKLIEKVKIYAVKQGLEVSIK